MTPSVDRAPRPATKGRAGTASRSWLELSVEADVEAVEAVSEILARVGTGGTTIEPAFRLIDDGLGATIDPTRPATVRAYVPADDPASARRAVTTAEDALGHLQAFSLRPIGELRSQLIQDDDWSDAWKAHFPVTRIARRLVIRPSWRRHRRQSDDVVIALDPGMAFGTGLHPTTRLCLVALETLADEGRLEGATVLDVGCGSGILSLAAVGLGATTVLALDTDPVAIEATSANVRRNSVSRRVRSRLGSVPTADGPRDVVLANLVAPILISMAADLAAEVRPAGRLVAGGIFVDRETEVRTAFGRAGLQIAARLVEGDWVTLTASRAA